MALLQRITTPVVALLPDLDTVPQRRQAIGAVVASLVVHLLIFLLFASMAGLLPEVDIDFAKPKTELQPLELTIMDEPAPQEMLSAAELQARAQIPMIDSDGLAPSTEKPKEALFESDQDMKAASQQPATGDAPLPSQDGRALPFMGLKDQDVTLGPMKPPAEAAPPAEPVVEPSQPEKAMPEPAATPMPAAAATPPPPAPDVLEPNDTQIAVATKMTEVKDGPVTQVKPTPAFRNRTVQTPERTDMVKLATPSPRTTDAGFQEEQIKTRIEGNISNRGLASVDAVKTPLGVYMKQVKAAIASRWYFYMKQRRDLYTTGSAKVSFVITQDGKIREVRLDGNTSNSAFGFMCQQSVAEAEIAPPPEEALPVMNDGKLEHDFTFNYVPIH